MNNQIVSRIISTPLGPLSIAATEKGICQISFGNEGFIFNSLKLKGYEIVEGSNALLHALDSEVKLFFTGKLKEFSVPLDLQQFGTDFQVTVWKELLRIPYGETRSYTQQTKRLGDLKAIRAVATANGKNPIAIVIPCHRVIGSDGSLTGYAGGLNKKKWLLAHEAKWTGKGVQKEMF